MNGAAFITLNVDMMGGGIFVSSPQFPLLHLMIDDESEGQFHGRVVPVLKHMIEAKVGYTVTLRLIPAFREEGEKASHHVLAEAA